ncbi:MAG: MFS transporter [Halothiobacillaceae bacterium]
MTSEPRGPRETDQPRSVQDYIDEMPVWQDGTPTGFSPMTVMQWRIWILATAGKFFEGMVVFMTGVALPLMAHEFNLEPAEKGLAGAASLFGILVGALVLGGLADSLGRKRMFIAEIVLLVLFLLGLTFAGDFWMVVLFLFGIGVALGCDYPTAHAMISESIPSRQRGQLVLGAFAFQAVGALTGTVVGYLVLVTVQDVSAWRWMYAVAILPAMAVIAGRFFIPESSHWLMTRDRRQAAETALARLLAREPRYPQRIRLSDPRPAGPESQSPETGYRALLRGRNRRATLFASVPWFLQDLGTYGIGIFTPTILATLIGVEAQAHNISGLIHNDIQAAKGAAFLDLLLIVGIAFAVFLSDRFGRIRLQVIGFFGCALGLGLAAASAGFSGATATVLIFAGFMLFNFMTNLGPNAQTYLIAGEVFPTHLRGKGAGLAAAIGKVGAVITAFLFPVLLHMIGTTWLLGLLVGTSLLGAWVTWKFRIETRGVNLEQMGETTQGASP